MLRTCASIGVDDCETANGVTYCYCKNELCNNPSKKLSNPNPGSGLLSSPQKSTELLIDTNKQKVEGELGDTACITNFVPILTFIDSDCLTSN